jgi:O6-methylguanine-DNA--protein-cysteine methyltransferase
MFYDTMRSDLGPILVARDDTGISRIHFLDSPKPLTKDDRWRRRPTDALLKDAQGQLADYFKGRRRTFSLPLSLDGTDFQIRVWKALTTIAYGKTWSYKDLAEAVGNPAAYRAVGNANGKNRLSIVVP